MPPGEVATAVGTKSALGRCLKAVSALAVMPSSDSGTSQTFRFVASHSVA